MASQSKAKLSMANISREQVKKGYLPSFIAAFESNFPVLISTNSPREFLSAVILFRYESKISFAFFKFFLTS